MSKRLKMFVIVCTCLIVVGTCLAGIGLLLGATGSIELNHIFPNLGDKNASIQVGTTSSGDQATLTGERITDSVEINQPVSVIKTKVGLGDIKFIESDQFKVQYTYDKGIGKPDINIADGTLTIADKFSRGDVNFELKNWSSLKNNKGIEYKIYCPKGMNIKLVDVDDNLGDIHISDIKTETLKLQIDAGDIKLTNLTADTAEVEMDLGDINTENIQTNNLTINNNLGDISVEGTLSGKNSFEAEMGDIKVETTLGKDKYTLKLDANLGDVKVDDADMSGNYNVNNNTGNIINATTSAGDIKVKFH
ncbi:MAG: DUF4097 family beta strand repeat-containing protein [Aminipila sp.]